MRKGLILIIGLIVGYAISWAFTVGIIKLITMCFSIVLHGRNVEQQRERQRQNYQQQYSGR